MNRIFPITFKLLALVLTLIYAGNTYAQTSRGTLTGKVVAANNEPAAYVSIGLQGTSFGTTTNKDGEYTFKAPAGSYTIVISYIGVQPVAMLVTVTAGQTTNVPQITVNASTAQLTEVNVIASRSNRFTSRVSTDAAKIPLSSLENPQSYSTVTSALITEQQIFSVDDALRNAPGLQKMWDATGRAGDGGGYFTLRGFPTQTRLRNGVAGLVTSTVDAVNVEKVEVIKGPSATLFGSTLTSFGGLINRVTKKPYESFGLEIGQSVGSYSLNRTTIDFNSPLTNSKNVLFRLNAAHNYEGSFQNYGKSRTFAVAPSLTVKATDRLTFQFDAELYVGRNSAKPFFFFYSTPKDMGVSEVTDLGINYKNAYVNDDIRQYSRSMNYFAQANYQISDNFTSQTIFSSSSSYSDGSNPFFYLANDATIIQSKIDTTITPSENGRGYVVRADQATKDSKLSAIEVQHNLNGDFNTGSVRHRFVFGLDYQRQNSNQLFFSNFYGAAPLQSSTFDYGSFNQAAVNAKNAANPLTVNNTYTYYYKTNTYSTYLSDVVNLTDRLIASAGLRLDHYRHGGSQNFDRVQTAAAFNQTTIAPKFGLIFQPIKDQVSLFANYQNGFVNPGMYTNADSVTTVAKTQNANQIEGGVKLSLFDGKLSGTISYYNIKLTNSLRSVAGLAFFAQVQDGTQVSKGFETEIIATPYTGFNVIAGFAYNNSKYINAGDDVNGLRPVEAGSPYLANFYLSYRLAETAVKGLGAGLGGNFASKNKVVNSVAGGTLSLPEYYLFNANIFFDRTKYRFGAAVNNLTNKQYYTGYTTVNPQRLRQFILSASYKF